MSEVQETKIIADIVTHLSWLIENPRLLKNMREQWFSDVMNGKVSMKTKQQQLEKIFSKI
jgi:hypothetical protein